MYPSSRTRRFRRNLADFKILLGAPATEAFALPAGADLLVRASGDIAEGVELGTVGGKPFLSKGLVAGGLQRLGYFERSAQITPLVGLELMIDTGLGRYQPISVAAED